MLSQIPPAEWTAWLGFRQHHTRSGRELAPVDLYAASLLPSTATPSDPTARPTTQAPPLESTVAHLRRLAQRDRSDAILVYEITSSQQLRSTEGSLLDLTLVGTFARTRQSDTRVRASAALVDAATGQVLGTAFATAGDERSAALFGSETRLARQTAEVETLALERLLFQLDAMLAHLDRSPQALTREPTVTAMSGNRQASDTPVDTPTPHRSHGAIDADASSFWHAEQTCSDQPTNTRQAP